MVCTCSMHGQKYNYETLFRTKQQIDERHHKDHSISHLGIHVAAQMVCLMFIIYTCSSQILGHHSSCNHMFGCPFCNGLAQRIFTKFIL